MLSKIQAFVKRNKILYALYSLTIRKILITIGNKQMKRREKEIQENGLNIIKEIDSHINNMGVPCFVDSGTLLGTVREGKLLSWDYDIDFGIFLSNERDWDFFESIMKGIGYSKCRQFTYEGKITEQTYKRNNTYIDFFNHCSDEQNSYYYAYIRKQGYVYDDLNKMHPLKYKTVKISGLKMGRIENIEVHIPNEAEEYLTALYGDDWRIPNPNWVEDGNLPTCESLPGFGICEKFK